MRMRVPAYLVTYFAAALPARPRREFEPVLTNLRPRRGGASQGGRWRQARALKKVETDTELRAYFLTRRVHPCIRYHRPFLYSSNKLYTTYFNFNLGHIYLRIALGPRWVDAWEPRARRGSPPGTALAYGRELQLAPSEETLEEEQKCSVIVIYKA